MALEREGNLSGRLGEAIAAVASALAALPVPGMLIGGMAVIARGVPRLTRDVDATVAGGSMELDVLVAALAPHGLLPRIDEAVAFAAAHQVLLLRHAASGVDVDLSIAWLPFEFEALARAELLDVGGVSVPVACPEDLVVYKAVAFRPQDRQDIERLVSLYGESIDLDRVRRIVGEFAAALDEPNRVRELDAIIRSASGE